MRAASGPFEAWVKATFVPVARRLGFTGVPPTFRRKVGTNWLVWGVERRRIDPPEAVLIQDDPRVEFRVQLGVVSPAVRPKWMPSQKHERPTLREMTILGNDPALEPPDGWFHIFDSGDPAASARLGDRLATGVERGLRGLEGSAPDRRILELKLSVAGPLENLGPGHIEELLALAESAGASDITATLVAAARRPDLADPELGALRGGWKPPIGRLAVPLRKPNSPKSVTRLIGDMRAGPVTRRRLAAAILGSGPSTDSVLDALREALAADDGYLRSQAAASLAFLGDQSPETWSQVLRLAADSESDSHLLGSSVVLLQRLDPEGRRSAAGRALGALAVSNPAWARDLDLFSDQLA